MIIHDIEHQEHFKAIQCLRDEAEEQKSIWRGFETKSSNLSEGEVYRKYQISEDKLIDAMVEVSITGGALEEDRGVAEVMMRLEEHWHEHNDCQKIVNVCECLLNQQYLEALQCIDTNKGRKTHGKRKVTQMYETNVVARDKYMRDKR